MDTTREPDGEAGDRIAMTTPMRWDPPLTTSRRGMRALGVSFAVLMATTLAQAVLVLVTGSVALLADTLHNLGDALTAVPLAIAFLLARRAATARFPHGLGRVVGAGPAQ